MGLVNSPAFPSLTAPAEPKPKKSKKTEKPVPIVEPVVLEECCALGCDDCFLPEEPVDE